MKPEKIVFYIGGYPGPYHYLSYDGDELVYTDSAGGIDSDSNVSITPSRTKWKNFKTKLDTIDIWGWDKRYVMKGVCDGTQWEFEVHWGSQKIRSYGDNDYPESFEMLLQAIRNLSSINDIS
ncbi:MAG: hypothetical protein RQ867_06755 [Mariprofundaceae bacterium]|nr:hypothetical protein [Mariprofundaceae bacterium]